MEIYPLSSGWLASNSYLLVSGNHAVVVDPGVSETTILDALRKANATPEFILLTHGHFDHLLSMEKLQSGFNIPVYIHKNDLLLPESSEKNAFGSLFGREKSFQRPDRTFSDGDELSLGSEKIRVLHTPGHTAGSVCFQCGDEILLTGDTLFADGVGRTDLYSGDAATLQHSLLRLSSLPHDFTIYPGHGECSRLKAALSAVLYE